MIIYGLERWTSGLREDGSSYHLLEYDLESGVHLYCPVIVKYRDEKTSGSITLEDLLR